MGISDIRARALETVRVSEQAKEIARRAEEHVSLANAELMRAQASLDAASAQTDEQGNPTGDVSGAQQAVFAAELRMEAAARALQEAREDVDRINGWLRAHVSETEQYVAGEQGNLSKLACLQGMRFGANASAAAAAVAGRMNIAEETRALLLEQLGMGGGARTHSAGGAVGGSFGGDVGGARFMERTGMQDAGALGAGLLGTAAQSGEGGNLPVLDRFGAGKGGYYGGFIPYRYDSRERLIHAYNEERMRIASTNMSAGERAARLNELHQRFSRADTLVTQGGAFYDDMNPTQRRDVLSSIESELARLDADTSMSAGEKRARYQELEARSRWAAAVYNGTDEDEPPAVNVRRLVLREESHEGKFIQGFLDDAAQTNAQMTPKQQLDHAQSMVNDYCASSLTDVLSSDKQRANLSERVSIQSYDNYAAGLISLSPYYDPERINGYFSHQSDHAYVKANGPHPEKTAIHEYMHFLSRNDARSGVMESGRNLQVNEALTELFCKKAMGDDYPQNPSVAYINNMRLMESFERGSGNELLRRAYFGNDPALLRNEFDGVLGAGKWDEFSRAMDDSLADVRDWKGDVDATRTREARQNAASRARQLVIDYLIGNAERKRNA